MPTDRPAIALAAPTPRDEAIQSAVLELVNAFAFREAEAVLAAYRAETEGKRWTHVQRLLLDWYELPEADRPDFLTFAHHRRTPELPG
ncbi:MAG: hypothetical protein AAF183_16445 [Pseudomonadota bacterium]